MIDLTMVIPDREDRHAINKIDRKDVLDFFDDADWRNVHDAQRHARHLMIFKRIT